jgi:hypothetical protein
MAGIGRTSSARIKTGQTNGVKRECPWDTERTNGVVRTLVIQGEKHGGVRDVVRDDVG